MTHVLWIALLINAVALGGCLVLLAKLTMRGEERDSALQAGQREQLQQLRCAMEDRERAYARLSQAVAKSLMEIREDIGCHYHHTHEGHVLDRVAFLMERMTRREPQPLLWLDAETAEQVEAAGGQVVSGTMDLGQLLAFGWAMHRCARERAGQLAERICIPCGYTPLSRWLGEQLAIFELMCGRDRSLAIERLAAVVDAWKSEPDMVPFVPPHIDDVRSPPVRIIGCG